jgi:protocatechuate 3,4-dioxygenase, beta subunit
MRTPDQVLGPYFPAGLSPATNGDLTFTNAVGASALGEVIEVGGTVRNLDGDAVRGVRILVWQANSFGRYAHPNDLSTDAPLDPNFLGFADVRSSDAGAYRIRTVKPGSYSAGGSGRRAPHIHFEVHGRFERLITQMYFPGEPLNQEDAFLQSSRTPGLLIATAAPSVTPADNRAFRFDIVLTRG